jgi:hypothetical protein
MMTEMSDKQYRPSPIGDGVKWFFVLLTVLPIAVALAILWSQSASFEAMPGWALGLLFGLGPAVLIVTAAGIRNPMIRLGKNGLLINVSFIHKTWAISELNRTGACLVDLEQRRDLRPKWKLWGAAMPGLSSGLFKLHNGEKSHLYLTDRRNVVFIPTAHGPILLSLENPRQFIEHLKGLPC